MRILNSSLSNLSRFYHYVKVPTMYIRLPVMRDAGEGPLGEDGVHLRPHLALRLKQVLRVPYPDLAVVPHRQQSEKRILIKFEFPAQSIVAPVSLRGGEAEVSGELAVVSGEGDEALPGGEVPEADVAVVGAGGDGRQPLGVGRQPEEIEVDSARL